MPWGRKRKRSSQPSQVAKETCNHEEVDEGNEFFQGDIKRRSSDEDTGVDLILEPKHKIFLSHSGAQKEFAEHLCGALEASCHYPFYDRRRACLPKEKDPKNRIVVKEWKFALDILGSFNGLVYDRLRKEITAYEKEIVTVVCESIIPDIKWDDSHVQGKSSICEVILEKMKEVGNSEKSKGKVGGIYGVGGIGKTTTCHALCNELSKEYEGRVCHIEFQSEASKDFRKLREKYYKELLQKVLIELLGKSREAIEPLNEGQCKDILYKSLSKQKVFLAIDNVWDDLELKEQAKMYLEARYHKDSLVMVTSRSKGVLGRLGIDGDACLEMPELGKEDAVKLFLQHAVGGTQEFEVEEMDCILKCVKRCYFSKGGGEGHHYHPLSLKVLGLLMSDHGGNPREWVKHLSTVRTFSELSMKNPVFDILRRSFDVLLPSLQTLFMDVGFFFLGTYPNIPMREWICIIHRQDEAEIKHRLETLKRRGLLQDVDLASGRVSMHDLYREFGKLELTGKLKESTDLRKRRWMYVDNGDMTDLERKPTGGCWQELIRLAIISPWSALKNHSIDVDGMECGKGIKWDHFLNVEVLQLSNLHWKGGALNLEPMEGLRSLDVCNVTNLYRIEGFEGLKNLIHMQWVWHEYYKKIQTDSPIVGLLPKSLKTLLIYKADGVLHSDLLTQCSNLLKLDFFDVRIDSLDLRNCQSLDSVELTWLKKCQALLLPGADRPSCLRSLQVTDCKDLVDIPGIDRLTNLQELRVQGCPKLKVRSLLALTQLQVLELCRELSLERAKDIIPRQLRKLQYRGERAEEELNLDGFDQLEDLDLSWTHGLTSLGAMGGLPALRRLHLGYCKNLLRLPDLSKSRHLECLRVTECTILVHIPGIDRVTNLRELHVVGCPKLKVPSLLALTLLQTLKLCGEPSLERAKDCIPGQLRELRYCGKRAVEEVNLDGFNQLEVLDLSGTHGLTSLEAVGGLPALRRLHLWGCKNLLRLPDLSMSRHLERLSLNGCLSLELHGRDIKMLRQCCL